MEVEVCKFCGNKECCGVGCNNLESCENSPIYDNIKEKIT